MIDFTNSARVLLLVLAAESLNSCQCDTTEYLSCSAQLQCPNCTSCLSGFCRPGIDLCDDGLDNDCDGDTDEGCGELCGDTACNDPPARDCLDEDRLRYFSPAGVCVDEQCEYPAIVVTCNMGCLNESCLGDACLGLVCTGDSNPCTDDGCDPLSGCTHIPNTAPCEDGDLCTGQDMCRGGVCVVGSERDCDDGLSCTSERCEPAIGCVITPDDMECDDLDPCTDNLCDASAGCVFPLNAATCDDGDPCTMDDMCLQGECEGVPLDDDQDTFIAMDCGGDDCDDGDPSSYPGAIEVCDGKDNDCDGLVDLLGRSLCDYDAICQEGAMRPCSDMASPTIAPTVITDSRAFCSLGSPFLLEESMVVTGGARLTVGPCVEVLAADGVTIFLRDGGIEIKGDPNRPAVFRSSSSAPDRGSWGGIVQQQSDDIYIEIDRADIRNAECGVDFGHENPRGHARIHQSIFSENDIAVCGSLDMYIEILESRFVGNNCGVSGVAKIVDNCEFIGNQYGTEWSGSVIVNDSIFRGNGVALHGYNGEAIGCLIENNEVAVAPYVSWGLSYQLTDCTVIDNQSGILVSTAGSLPCRGNIFCNNGSYDIRMQGQNEVDATGNWWCTADRQEIAERIYDIYDDTTLGRVVFEPYLLESP